MSGNLLRAKLGAFLTNYQTYVALDVVEPMVNLEEQMKTAVSVASISSQLSAALVECSADALLLEEGSVRALAAILKVVHALVDAVEGGFVSHAAVRIWGRELGSAIAALVESARTRAAAQSSNRLRPFLFRLSQHHDNSPF